MVVNAIDVALSYGTDWTVPIEYTESHTSEAVAKVVLGYYRAI